MVVVERIVPPRAVFFLFGNDEGGEFFGVGFLFFRRQKSNRFGEIVDAIIVEVAGDFEMNVVGFGAFAGDGKPTFALQEAVGPFDDDFVGDAPRSNTRRAALQAWERAREPAGRLISVRGRMMWLWE